MVIEVATTRVVSVCVPTTEAWFGQDPEEFVKIIAGAVQYTTPQVGDVYVEFVDENEEHHDACYTARPGAFGPEDPWLADTAGGWCCDGFPALKECGGDVDYSRYAAVVENTYVEPLRRRGICPPYEAPAQP